MLFWIQIYAGRVLNRVCGSKNEMRKKVFRIFGERRTCDFRKQKTKKQTYEKAEL